MLRKKQAFAALSGALTIVTGVTVSQLGGHASAQASDRAGYITVAGGVKLAYDLTLPAAKGRFPVALEYDDYGVGEDNDADNSGSDAGDLLAAGFAVLGVNQPGSGCSGGVNDVADVDEWGRVGAQVVEWAAAQPWSTGHVGMFGSSWTGITQLGVASFRPKGLDAITPFHVATDFYRDVAYPGGVYDASFMQFYSAGLARIDAQTADAGIARGDRQCGADYRSHVGPDKKYVLSVNSAANPFYDAYWDSSPIGQISRIDIPVLGCQSWQDGLVGSRSTELYYDTLDRKTTWFIGLNGGHGECEFSQPLGMMVQFLRHYVAGADNGWQRTPHITIFHDVLSPPGTATSVPPGWKSTYDNWSGLMKPVALYFQGNASLATSAATVATAGRSSFSGPAPSQSGDWTARPSPGTSVSYTTPPLSHDVDFFGPGSVNLWVSSTARDSDIEVILSEVRPDGQEQYVQAGWLDLAKRKLAPAGDGPYESSTLRPYQLFTSSSYEPLAPGRPVYARVELLPFEHVFRKGSSIRVTIDSAMGQVQSTGDWGMKGSTTKFKDTIYATGARASEVVLGLIPGATAKSPMPACEYVAGEPCRANAVPVPPGQLNIP
jgi:uncharacterized protein